MTYQKVTILAVSPSNCYLLIRIIININYKK